MPGNLRRLIYRCAFGIALLALAAGSRTFFARNASGMSAIWQPKGVALPAELSRVSDDLTDGLVAAVTADIDADGDLDFVATDQSLNLLVWVNDGRGHLTRQRPRHSGGAGTNAAGPTLERRSTSPPLSTLNDPPTLGVAHRPSLDPKLPSATRPPTSDPFVLAATASHGPSRAPPFAEPLT